VDRLEGNRLLVILMYILGRMSGRRPHPVYLVDYGIRAADPATKQLEQTGKTFHGSDGCKFVEVREGGGYHGLAPRRLVPGLRRMSQGHAQLEQALCLAFPELDIIDAQGRYTGVPYAGLTNSFLFYPEIKLLRYEPPRSI
jgi:hypothetical protein